MVFNAPLLLFNELSLDATAAPADVYAQIQLFSEMLRAAKDVRRDISLVSPVELAGTPACMDGRSLAALADGNPALRERWRAIRSMQNRAPFATFAAPAMDPDYEEYLESDRPASGLGVAAATGQLAVSLTSRPGWESVTIELMHVQLDEASNQRETKRQAVHAARAAHVEAHAEHLRLCTLPQPFAGQDLWDQRAALFPNLEFLDQVRKPLLNHPAGSQAVQQIAQRLTEIDAACETWTDGPSPAFGPNVTAESDSRKQVCWISTPSGDRLFSLHARYTPNMGRIHIATNRPTEPAKVTVGYIGPKIRPDL